MSDGLKMGFFRATVESILLYGSTAWTLTQSLDKKLDGACTNILRVAKNVTWGSALQMKCFMQDHLGSRPQLERGALGFSGHCWRSENEVISDLNRGEPKHGKGEPEDRLAHLSIC